MRIRKRRKDGVVQHYHVAARPPKIVRGQKQVIKIEKGEPVFVNLRPIPKRPDDPNFKVKIKMIPVDDIEMLEEPHFKNRRKIEDIKASGDILKPIKVHAKYSPEHKYQLWDGHHRLIAARERGDKLIPAEIDLNRFAHKDWRKRHGK